MYCIYVVLVKKDHYFKYLDILEKHNASLYYIVAAQHQKVHHYNFWHLTGCAMVNISWQWKSSYDVYDDLLNML